MIRAESVNAVDWPEISSPTCPRANSGSTTQTRYRQMPSTAASTRNPPVVTTNSANESIAWSRRDALLRVFESDVAMVFDSRG